MLTKVIPTVISSLMCSSVIAGYAVAMHSPKVDVPKLGTEVNGKVVVGFMGAGKDLKLKKALELYYDKTHYVPEDYAVSRGGNEGRVYAVLATRPLVPSDHGQNAVAQLPDGPEAFRPISGDAVDALEVEVVPVYDVTSKTRHGVLPSIARMARAADGAHSLALKHIKYFIH